MSKEGKIFMIPVDLGSNNLDQIIPFGVMQIVRDTKLFAVENLRTARRYLKKIDKAIVIDDLNFFELNATTRPEDIEKMLKIVQTGENLGIMSEAGCPGIADPGAILTNAAHKKGIRVIPLVGPSSILLALIASGLNGQNFAFNGYLPVKNPGRNERLLELERKVIKENQTQLFMETPYRNNSLLDDLLKICRNDLMLCIASEITTEFEFIRTMNIGDWRKNKPDLNKKPAIFILGK